ncbi:ATP-grasp domain-containing protein [Catenovulum sp. SM1970]|uniref:ATP-grasp domain-containing protein n=1 Tax=Marinifaba aquimaris TaxID=2741323 RepID=UPI0015736FEB|nr:ATP-grasp domain-containing protein [Marinifaba aquimaris]NTS77025.1 ATP-grasp domain-containing protein [Marinifaba aquimaris]
MSDHNVGIWMYQNGGGDRIEQTIISQLAQRNINCITGLDLNTARSTHGQINCRGTIMEELDAFFSYNAGQQTQYQTYLYQALNHSIPILNNYDAFALTEDKYQTAHLLQQHGITTSDYHLIHKNDIEGLKCAIRACGGKVVYKPTEGWGGVGIVKIESERALDMLLPFISRTDLRYFYVERFIDYDNTDYRIDIVDGQYIGCYGRKAPDDDWKTNVTSGGTIFVRDPEDEVIELAKRAAKITGLEIAGVDIIYDREREEYVVLEVNGIPAFATPEQEKLGLNFNGRKINAIVDLIEKTVSSNNKHTDNKAA